MRGWCLLCAYWLTDDETPAELVYVTFDPKNMYLARKQGVFMAGAWKMTVLARKQGVFMAGPRKMTVSGQKTGRFYGQRMENDIVGQKTGRFYGRTEENDSVGQKTRRFKPKWAMVASHTARRSCITNMYLAEKSDGSPKYTLAQRMSVSGHKTENQYINYIKCSLDEVAEMVDAANDKDGDNLF